MSSALCDITYKRTVLKWMFKNIGCQVEDIDY